MACWACQAWGPDIFRGGIKKHAHIRKGDDVIVCGGDALIDFVPATTGTGEAAFMPRIGGSCLNVAVAMARLGSDVGFLGGVSTDMFGDMIAEYIKKSGVRTDFLTRSAAPTTLAFVSLSGGEARYAFFDENSAARMWTHDPARIARRKVSALHVGSVTLIDDPSASAYEQLVTDLRPHAVISLDPNCRTTLVGDTRAYRARMMRFAAMAHIVRLSEEDFAFLYPGQGEADIVARLLEGGTQLVVITRGAAGAGGFSRDMRVDVDAVETRVVDTIGAGDTFQGALLTYLADARLLGKDRLARLTRDDLARALRFAVHAAALTCGQAGCTPPDSAAMQAALS